MILLQENQVDTKDTNNTPNPRWEYSWSAWQEAPAAVGAPVRLAGPPLQLCMSSEDTFVA